MNKLSDHVLNEYRIIRAQAIVNKFGKSNLSLEEINKLMIEYINLYT